MRGRLNGTWHPAAALAGKLLPVLLLTACATPFLTFSGGRLQGPQQHVESFAFAAQYSLLTLEVRPQAPYSVILRVVMRDDQLYIDAADKRRWHTYLRADPRVRVKLGETIYPATAVRVDEPAELGGFIAGRAIYRLVPAAETGAQ